MRLLLPFLLLVVHTSYALNVAQNYPKTKSGGLEVTNPGLYETNFGTSEVKSPLKDVGSQNFLARQWRESLRAWERSLRKERAKTLETTERKRTKKAKRAKTAQKTELRKSAKKKNTELKPEKRTFFKSSEPEPHYDHYDIFGYPGDHYYPHFMDYDDDIHYGDDYDKDDVDHGNFFVDQFHDLMDFFF